MKLKDSKGFLRYVYILILWRLINLSFFFRNLGSFKNFDLGFRIV